MARASISNSAPHAATPAFTLVEVVVALGLLAVTVVAMLALQGAITRSVAEVSMQNRAAQLADTITVELRRIRDLPVAEGQPGRLDALAELIPASDSNFPLQLVASRDGSRVIRVSDTDDPATGVALRDRYFLIEVRRQPAPLDYVSGAGYLAITLTVKWPYQMAARPSASAADLEQTSAAVLNTALTP